MGIEAAGDRGDETLPVRGNAPGSRGRDYGGGLGAAADESRQRSSRLGRMTARRPPAADGKARQHGSGINSGSRCGIPGCDGVAWRDHEVFQGAAAARTVARGMTPISTMRPPQHGQRSSERPVSCWYRSR
jgi:hypothetical protein